MSLEIVFPIEMERVLFKDKTEHFFKQVCSYRRVFVIKFFLCVAYYSNSFLLWDIRVKAGDIH